MYTVYCYLFISSGFFVRGYYQSFTSKEGKNMNYKKVNKFKGFTKIPCNHRYKYSYTRTHEYFNTIIVFVDSFIIMFI